MVIGASTTIDGIRVCISVGFIVCVSKGKVFK